MASGAQGWGRVSLKIWHRTAFGWHRTHHRPTVSGSTFHRAQAEQEIHALKVDSVQQGSCLWPFFARLASTCRSSTGDDWEMEVLLRSDPGLCCTHLAHPSGGILVKDHRSTKKEWVCFEEYQVWCFTCRVSRLDEQVGCRESTLKPQICLRTGVGWDRVGWCPMRSRQGETLKQQHGVLPTGSLRTSTDGSKEGDEVSLQSIHLEVKEKIQSSLPTGGSLLSLVLC